MCRLNEDEFTRRALLTEGVEPKQAKLLYFKLWSSHIDSRALLNRPGGSVEKLEAPKSKSKAKPKSNGAPKQIIKPGMFFRVKTGDTKENFDIVMAMGEENDEQLRKWTCAAVFLADEKSGAHELFVAKQAVVKTSALVDDMVLEYDSGTRYYYVKDKL